MDFASADPSIVRSTRQREMLSVWLALYSRIQQIPEFEEFKTNGLTGDLDDLVFYLVEPHGDGADFLIESDSPRTYQPYGKSGKGRYLHEYLPPKTRDRVMPVYNECVRKRLPMFTVSRVEAINGAEVEFERLLLPFADSAGVGRVIASLNTVSIAGEFEIRHLMKRKEFLPRYDILSVIDREAQMADNK
jgi:hypothetical protein